MPHSIAPAADLRRRPLQEQDLREIPHIRKPTGSQERTEKKKSACSVRNDGWAISVGCSLERLPLAQFLQLEMAYRYFQAVPGAQTFR